MRLLVGRLLVHAPERSLEPVAAQTHPPESSGSWLNGSTADANQLTDLAWRYDCGMPHPSWNDSYATGEPLPWDTGTPDPLLVELIQSRAVVPA